MNTQQKLTQAGKEVTQMTKSFIPTDEQILESVRGQMLHELVDEFSVDLLNPEAEDQGIALADLTMSIIELSHTTSLEDISVFMTERGYGIVNVIGMVIEAFRLPQDQARALQNTIAKT